MRDFWVFGYGSLMWRPGFPYLDARPATLHGAHRALCVFSHVHRGTPERPGLVLGLDHGGSCRGIAFRVAGSARDDVIAYLRAREQVTLVYREVERAIRPAARVAGVTLPAQALCYMVDRTHPQYAGVLPLEQQIGLVRQGLGQSGANPDYVRSTVAHLRELGIHDRTLEAIVSALDDKK